MSLSMVTKDITAQNTFSDSLVLAAGNFNFSLSGTWAATVTVQRSFDEGTSWVDVSTFTSNTQKVGFEPESGTPYRFGVKTGEFTSGTVVGRISQ